MDVQIVAIAGDDAGGFLPAVLQRVETEISEVGGFGMAEDAEDTTLVVEVVVGESELLLHCTFSVRCRELAQTS